MTKQIDKENQKKAVKDIFLDCLPYVIIILVVIIIRTYIATPIRVNGTSMDPTLMEGETMILNKIGVSFKGIKRFDIVVVKTDDDYLIKRVIALPGESIKYTDGKLYINEKVMKDPYSKSTTDDFDVVNVKSNEYFVMGDNRAVSKDSRMIGTIKEKQIMGKTNIILFPFSKLGFVKE